MPDRIDQVGFSETDTSIDEERVVLFARLIGDRERGGVSELISRPDHKFGEGKFGCELRMPIDRWNFRTRSHLCKPKSSVAITIQMAVPVGFQNGRGKVRTERQLDFDRLAHLRGNGLAQQREIALVHPIFKKTIGGFDGSSFAVNSDEIERPYPGFKTDLAELIAHTIAGSFPHTVHITVPSAESVQ